MARTRWPCAVLVTTLSLAFGVVPAPAAPAAAAGPGHASTPEQRHAAILRLEEAAARTPHDPKVLDALGHAYLVADHTHLASQAFERAHDLAPNDADACFGLGQVWKRGWVETLDPSSMVKAIEYFEAAALLRPEHCDTWVALAVLRFEHGDARAAAEAAMRAVNTEPDRTEAMLAAAFLGYRAGDLSLADSLFTVALPRLDPALAARFADITPLVGPGDGEALAAMGRDERAEVVRRFWSENDPDPTSRRNAARLEYWSRLAQASLLFDDPASPRWDVRAELCARYGAPGQIAYEPPGVPLAQRPNKQDNIILTKLNGFRYVGDAAPMWYPLHGQIWNYPGLGMRVLLEDLTLSQHFELPRREYDTDPQPVPDSLASHGLLATAGGRGVFAPLPPGVHARPLAGNLARFEGERGPRILAQVETHGEPSDSLWAVCVVIDSTEHEVARSTCTLAPSLCDPATRRSGDFAFDLPPGRYRVACAVDDGLGGRGVLRTATRIGRSASLSMSDLVLVCGPLDAAGGATTVRLNPNLSASVVGGEALHAYFEVYHLQTDAKGRTRFEYDYTVHAEGETRRPWYQRLFKGDAIARVAVRSEEEGAGPLRRQFLTVPAGSLAPGKYRLTVGVSDRLSGTRTEQWAAFVKRGP